MTMYSSNFNRRFLQIQLLLLLLLGGLAVARDWSLSEISSVGNVIRYTGEVGIDTQELIKLELGRSPEDRVKAEKLRRAITAQLDALSAGDPAVRLKSLNDFEYREELSRLYMQWRKLDGMIDICRSSPETNIHLFMLSMEYYDQSKVTLAAAERYSFRLDRLIGWERVAGGVLWGLVVLVPLCLLFTKIGKPDHGSAE